MQTIVMIPTYNERENISHLLQQVLEIDKDIEVLVVDDNSPAGTWKIVEDMSKKSPRVHLLHRKKRKGRGTAGIDGLRYAIDKRADYIIEMDADFSHNPKYIPEFLNAVKDYDVVIGSRFVKGGQEGQGVDEKAYHKIGRHVCKDAISRENKGCVVRLQVFQKRGAGKDRP